MPSPGIALDGTTLRWCWGGVAVYLLMLLAIGFAGRRRVGSVEDYALAGRRFPFSVATAALLAAWFGVGSCLGIAGQVCQGGLRDVAADPFASALSLVLAGFFVAGALRKRGETTVTDCIAARFGRAAGVYASAWMVPVYVGWLAALVLGLGAVVRLLTGLDAQVAQGAGAAVILLYTVAGGMWSVSVTDIVQLLLILLGLALILPGSLSQAGGLREVLAANADALTLFPGPPPEGVSPLDHGAFVAGEWMVMGLGCMAGQDLAQRVLACRSRRVAVHSTVAAGVLYLAVTCAPILIGLAAKTVLPAHGVTPETVGEGFGNQVFARMAILSVGGWHPAALALVFCTLLSAIMSSADGALLAASSLAVNGILLPIRPGTTPRAALRWARAATVATLVAAAALASRAGSVYRLTVNCWAAQLVVVLVPLLAALHLPRATRRSAWAAMVAGPLAWGATVVHAAARCVAGGMTLAEALASGTVEASFTAGAAWGFLAAATAFAASHLAQLTVDG